MRIIILLFVFLFWGLNKRANYNTVNVVESGDNFLFLYETINYDYGKLYFSKPY